MTSHRKAPTFGIVSSYQEHKEVFTALTKRLGSIWVEMTPLQQQRVKKRFLREHLVRLDSPRNPPRFDFDMYDDPEEIYSFILDHLDQCNCVQPERIDPFDSYRICHYCDAPTPSAKKRPAEDSKERGDSKMARQFT
jgi:hypothetical protein